MTGKDRATESNPLATADQDTEEVPDGVSRRKIEELDQSSSAEIEVAATRTGVSRNNKAGTLHRNGSVSSYLIHIK